MRFIHRLGYYLGGFAIGLIILAFFFSGKKTSCAYFPEARVLKSLRAKPYTLSAKAESSLKQLALDTISINKILLEGDVDFGESQTRKEPCGIFIIQGDATNGKEMQLTLENCEEKILIQNVKLATNN